MISAGEHVACVKVFKDEGVNLRDVGEKTIGLRVC
jgi:hypothetical protein